MIESVGTQRAPAVRRHVDHGGIVELGQCLFDTGFDDRDRRVPGHGTHDGTILVGNQVEVGGQRDTDHEGGEQGQQ